MCIIEYDDCVWFNSWCVCTSKCNRPYKADSTITRPIYEVKQLLARIVLRWVTTGEVLVLITFLFSSFTNVRTYAHTHTLPAYNNVHEMTTTNKTIVISLQPTYIIHETRYWMSPIFHIQTISLEYQGFIHSRLGSFHGNP